MLELSLDFSIKLFHYFLNAIYFMLYKSAKFLFKYNI
jgi:hypothetical protein